MQLSIFKEENLDQHIYIAVVSPPSEIVTEVLQFKKELVQKYGNLEGNKSYPHITVCHLKSLPEHREKIIEFFEEILEVQAPIKINLNNFKCFENSNSIFIDVEKKSDFASLSKLIKIGLRRNPFPYKKLAIITSPYLPVAKELPTKIFHEASADFQLKVYNREFIAKELTILEASMKSGTNRDFQTLAKFPFPA